MAATTEQINSQKVITNWTSTTDYGVHQIQDGHYSQSTLAYTEMARLLVNFTDIKLKLGAAVAKSFTLKANGLDRARFAWNCKCNFLVWQKQLYLSTRIQGTLSLSFIINFLQLEKQTRYELITSGLQLAKQSQADFSLCYLTWIYSASSLFAADYLFVLVTAVWWAFPRQYAGIKKICKPPP